MAEPHGPGFGAALAAERGALLRLARAKLRDAALAEDLVQDTLLAAWQGDAAYEGRAALRTWLAGILLNRIADHWRRRRRCPEVEPAAGDDADDVDAGSPGTEPVDRIDPLRRLAAREQVDAAWRALEAQSPQAARLLALRELDGLAHADAAARLGLAAREATELLHRVRRGLREQLADVV